MTDDRMDALLHEVGGRWRDANTDAAVVPDLEPRQAARRPRRWSVLASVAAVVAVLVTGGVVALNAGDDRRAAPAASQVVTPRTDPALTGTWTVFAAEPMGGGVSGGALPTIIFGEGSYRIEGLCSGRGGRWTATGSELTVDPSGLRTCGDTGAYAAAVVDVMSGRITYGIDGNTLTLQRHGTTLRLTKQ